MCILPQNMCTLPQKLIAVKVSVKTARHTAKQVEISLAYKPQVPFCTTKTYGVSLRATKIHEDVK